MSGCDITPLNIMLLIKLFPIGQVTGSEVTILVKVDAKIMHALLFQWWRG